MNSIIMRLEIILVFKALVALFTDESFLFFVDVQVMFVSIAYLAKASAASIRAHEWFFS